MVYDATKFMVVLSPHGRPYKLRYKSRASLLNLAPECMHRIMIFLDALDLAHLMRTCRTLYKGSDQSVDCFLNATLDALPVWQRMRCHHPNMLTPERLERMSLTALKSYVNWHGFSPHNILERARVLNAPHVVQLWYLKQWLRETCNLETLSIMEQPLRSFKRTRSLNRDKILPVYKTDSVAMHMSRVAMIAGTSAMVLKLTEAPNCSYIDIGVMRHAFVTNVTMVPSRQNALQTVVNKFSFTTCRGGSHPCISGISRITLRRFSRWTLGIGRISGRDKRGPAEEVHNSATFEFDDGDTIALVLDMDAGTLSLYNNGKNCGVIDSGLWGAYKFVAVMPSDTPNENDYGLTCGAEADAYLMEHCGWERRA